MILSAEVSDAQEITNIHYSSEVAGILGKLSPTILCKNFYEPLLSCASILSVKNSNENSIIQGFLSYRTNAHKEAFSLPKKNLLLFREILKVLGKSPHYIFVILNVLRTERKVKLGLKKSDIEFGEIQILIVSKDAQGIGVGSKLLNNLLQNANEANIIVKTQSSEARNFYEKHGFIQIMENRILGSQLFILSYSKGK